MFSLLFPEPATLDYLEKNKLGGCDMASPGFKQSD